MLPSSPFGNVRGTSLLDVLLQLWPYLDVYEKLAVRLCSREGLRTHDALVHTVSVHDLWGRVLPASAREIYATLRRMLARGCRPRQLVLRLLGSSADARQARGLAVFKALEKLNGCDRKTIEASRRCVSHAYVHPDIPKTAGNEFRRYASTGGSSGSCCMSDGNYSSGSATTSTDGSSTRASNGTELNLASGRIRSGPPNQSYSGDVSTMASIIARDLERDTTSIDGTSAVTPPPAPALRSLRLEGVPLTPRIIRTLHAAAPHLTSLKLYGYDVTANVYDIGPAASTSAAARAELTTTAAAVDLCSVSPSAQPLDRTSSRGTVRLATRRSVDDVARAAAAATGLHQLSLSLPPAASEPCITDTTAAAAVTGGVPALLHQLAGNLTELNFQDCNDFTYGNSSVRGSTARGRRSGHPGDDNNIADADGAIVRRGVDRFDDSVDGGRIYGSYGDAGALNVGSGLNGSRNAGGAHAGGTHRRVEALLVALQECSRLRHLGLRHTGPNCPVLSALLTPAWGSREQRGQQPGLLDGFSDGGRSHWVGGGGRGEGGNQSAAAAALYLATLTHLSSFKLQSPLPSGVRPRLAAAVAHLTALTRLELGQRTAVRHVAAALLPPPALPLPYLRDLDIACAYVTSTGTLAQLAALTALTRLSVGAVHLMSPPSPSAAAAGATSPSNARVSLSPPPHSLPLPSALQELSVATPLPPGTLLALRLPYTLRTLRTTGFSLGPADAQTETHAGDDVGGSGGGGGGLPPLTMRPEAADVLSSCVQTLKGLFAYRDLGIELHIGFQAGSGDSSNGNGGGNGTASGSGAYSGQQRRYLAAPLDRPMGHWSWATHLVPLGLQGLELAGLELSYGEVAAVARHLSSLEDLRLDCRYPLSALPHLASLRRLRRLLLNASFWQQQQQQGSSHRQRPICTDASGSLRGGGAETAREPEVTATTALMRLCAAAPECLYDVALASYGRPAARFAAMQAVVGVEAALSRVGCGVLRVWVCP